MAQMIRLNDTIPGRLYYGHDRNAVFARYRGDGIFDYTREKFGEFYHDDTYHAHFTPGGFRPYVLIPVEKEGNLYSRHTAEEEEFWRKMADRSRL